MAVVVKGVGWVADRVDKAFGVEVCIACGHAILTMAFKGTGICCENCRKARDGGVDESRYGT